MCISIFISKRSKTTTYQSGKLNLIYKAKMGWKKKTIWLLVSCPPFMCYKAFKNHNTHTLPGSAAIYPSAKIHKQLLHMTRMNAYESEKSSTRSSIISCYFPLVWFVMSDSNNTECWLNCRCDTRSNGLSSKCLELLLSIWKKATSYSPKSSIMPTI